MKTIIEDFTPQGGKHCITNSLKQIFTYYGYPMSEEMIFGLASGLSFLYLNQSDSPMVNGRIKVFEFEENWQSALVSPSNVNPGDIILRFLKPQSSSLRNKTPFLSTRICRI